MSHPSTRHPANNNATASTRGGDRQANSALWRVVITRTTFDPATKTYIARRTAEGLSKREAMRCLKRFVTRELYRYLPHPNPA